VVGAGVEQILERPELAVPADERRLEPLDAHRPAASGDDLQRAEQCHRFGLALELVVARRLVPDGCIGGPAGRVADEYRAGLCYRLNPARCVDQVTGHQSLAGRAESDGSLAGEHTGANPKVGGTDVLTHCLDRHDQLEGGPHSPLGIVFVRNRSAPDGHHGIADELLHDTAVSAHDRAANIEVAGEQLADLLWITRFGQPREADEVREQDRHQSAFCHGRRRSCVLRRERAPLRGEREGGLGVQRPAAVGAEACFGRRCCSALRAHSGQGCAALGAEPGLGTNCGSARRAAHDPDHGPSPASARLSSSNAGKGRPLVCRERPHGTPRCRPCRPVTRLDDRRATPRGKRGSAEHQDHGTGMGPNCPASVDTARHRPAREMPADLHKRPRTASPITVRHARGSDS